MAKIHVAIELTGGGLALDGISSAVIGDTEMAWVQMPSLGEVTYVYQYESGSTEDESVPDVIKPNDSTGTGRWIKLTVVGSQTEYAHGHWRYTTANGVDPITPSASGVVPLNDEVSDDITSGSYPDASYRIYLPAGNYKLWWYCNGHRTNNLHTTISDGSSNLLFGSTADANSTYQVTEQSVGQGRLALASATYIQMNYYAQTTTYTLGRATGYAATDEVHAELLVWKVS